MFIEILGLWSLLIFLFVGLHECEFFNLVNFQTPLLRGMRPKLQSPMILTPIHGRDFSSLQKKNYIHSYLCIHDIICSKAFIPWLSICNRKI